MKEVTVEELHKLFEEKADFQLVDVREAYEYDEANLNGELIPLGQVLDEQEKISKDKMVVVHCRSGARSAQAIFLLEQEGYDNLFNLRGGILEYAQKYGLS
jgi:adenylyltransferase/sulfurtransferase